jgi:hypothetical protein
MRNKGLFQRLVLAGMLAAGFLCIWGVVGLWAAEMGWLVERSLDDERLQIRSDGTPLVIHHEGRGRWRYRDLDGNAVTIPEDDHDPSLWLHSTQLQPSLPLRVGHGDISWEDRVRSFDDGRTPAVHWHFVRDGRPDGEAYFAGYDSQTKACVGYLGPSGFRAEMPAAGERFPFGGQLTGQRARVLCPEYVNRHRGTLEVNPPQGALAPWMVYVLGRDQKVYEVDLRKRTVRVLLDEPRLRCVALIGDRPGSERVGYHRLAARTDDEVLVLDENGRLLRRYPIPQALREKEFLFGETSAGEALMCWSSAGDFLARQIEHLIFWVRPDGHERSVSFTLPYHAPMRSMRASAAAVVPSPLALDVSICILLSAAACDSGEAATFPEALSLVLAEFWPALVIAQVFSAFLAVLCLRRQMRYGATKGEHVIWPLFVLVLGLPGWIGYRLGRVWPKLEACPECGVAVPLDREGCALCDAAFTRPALRGMEVFA